MKTPKQLFIFISTILCLSQIWSCKKSNGYTDLVRWLDLEQLIKNNTGF